MSFGLKTKHSLSNKFAIDAWSLLNVNEMIAFRLNSGNEIYFFSSEIKERFFLNQELKDTRHELKDIIIRSLNRELNLNESKIESFITISEPKLGGYSLQQYAGKAFIKNIDEYFAELFFDRTNDVETDGNNLSAVFCDINLSLGYCALEVSQINVGDIYRFRPKFEAINDNKKICSFTLGLNEIMVIKEEQGMSIEDDVGEQLIANEELKLDINISLGKIEMSITQMQDLLVGDFIDISNLSFPRVELNYKSKKIATAELVYNENKELSIEIKEVLIK